MELAGEWDTRAIHVIHEPDGAGYRRSTTPMHTLCKNGMVLPPYDDCTEIVQSACAYLMKHDIRHTVPMFLDLSDSSDYGGDGDHKAKKRDLNEVFCALTVLKDGHAYDFRGHYRKWYFNCPNIFVFLDVLPDVDLLTHDRWRVWTVDTKLELRRYEGELPNGERETS